MHTHIHFTHLYCSVVIGYSKLHVTRVWVWTYLHVHILYTKKHIINTVLTFTSLTLSTPLNF